MDLTRRRKRKKSKTFRTFVFFVVVIGFVLLVLGSPLFSIENIYVQGVSKYSDNKIKSKIGLAKGMNIFTFNYFSAKKELLKDSYIKEAEFKLDLPRTVTVIIEERKARGYVPFMGAYLYIDEKGRVLDSQTTFEEKLPIVVGLDFEGFKIGEILSVKNQDSFDVIMTMSQMMMKYNYIESVLQVDASDVSNIHLFVNKIDINIGDISECDKKIRTMIEIMKTRPEDDRGTLDLRNVDKPVFEYIS